MLKKTETEETILFFVTFLSLVASQLGGAGPLGPPMATPMTTSFNSLMVQEIYGDRDVTAVTSLKIKAFFSVQPARDANVNSNVKLLD